MSTETLRKAIDSVPYTLTYSEELELKVMELNKVIEEKEGIIQQLKAQLEIFRAANETFSRK